MKIFHLADIHASAKTLDQVKRCTQFVTEQAAIHQPDLTVIAGDIYDSRDIRLDSDPVRYIFEWVRQLSEYSPVFIVKGTPTHEGNAIKPLELVGSRHKILVADYPSMWGMVTSVSNNSDFVEIKSGFNISSWSPGLIISAMPTPTKQFMQAGDEDIASALTPIFAGFGTQAAQYEVPHIHVGHYCVRGASISENQTMVGKDIEIGRDQIELVNPDMVCLGHIHLHQEVEPGMFYAGSLIRKNHGENDDKGFYIYDLSMGKGNPKFIKTPADRLLRIREDFTKPDSGIDLGVGIHLNAYDAEELKGSILKVELTFWQDEGLEHTRESIEKFFEPCECQSINVQIIRKPRENIRSQEILKAESLSEKVKLLADQNKEEITPGVQSKCEMLETMNQDECIKALNEPVINGMDVDFVSFDEAAAIDEKAIEFVMDGPVKVDFAGPPSKQLSLFEV